MILELMGEIIKYLILLFFFVPVIVICLIFAFSKIKQKLTDWFGSELKNSNDNVRKAYVMKLDDEEVLKNVALSEYNQDIGVEAVERINTNSYLEEISKSDKFCVSRAAQRKLNELQ